MAVGRNGGRLPHSDLRAPFLGLRLCSLLVWKFSLSTFHTRRKIPCLFSVSRSSRDCWCHRLGSSEVRSDMHSKPPIRESRTVDEPNWYLGFSRSSCLKLWARRKQRILRNCDLAWYGVLAYGTGGLAGKFSTGVHPAT